uniref:Selenoprotein H n=1 Tax=Paramormyrops kingsleyae TaxID=1676925 RepID=A0A3B3S198_9TELE
LILSTAARQKRKASPEGAGEDVKKKKVNEEENQVEEEGQRIVIEHWSVGVRAALTEAFSDLKVQLNPQKPRRNSFEVTLFVKGEEVCLWSGLKKGPPRKLKFPDPAVVVSALEEALKSQ